MRVAIVHDWLTVYAGAEKVLTELLKLYPQADLFSVIDFFPEEKRSLLLHKRARTTFIHYLPFAKTKYPFYLPLMPFAIEQLDLRGYDLILSSSHAVAKGVIVSPGQIHVCYCHTPMRYAWDPHFEDARGKSLLAKWFLHKIRLWDSVSAARVDAFVANSHFVARRIEIAYRRAAKVIYPPTDLSRFPLRQEKEEFYLTASRLVPYKKIDLIVDAFHKMPQKRLVVVGQGPEYKKLKKRAPSNVFMKGMLADAHLADLMGRAAGFLCAALEDFGLAAVEAQACGTPVIAFGQGGAKETVCGLDADHPTGCFFERQSPEAIVEAIALFEQHRARISAHACRENALRFSSDRFRRELLDVIEKVKKGKSDENVDFSGWKRHEAMADVSEILSEAVFEDRRERFVFAANRENDAADARSGEPVHPHR